MVTLEHMWCWLTGLILFSDGPGSRNPPLRVRTCFCEKRAVSAWDTDHRRGDFLTHAFAFDGEVGKSVFFGPVENCEFLCGVSVHLFGASVLVLSAVMSCTYRVLQHLLTVQVVDISWISVFKTTLLNELPITSDGTRLEVFDPRSGIEHTNTAFDLFEADLALKSFY